MVRAFLYVGSEDGKIGGVDALPQAFKERRAAHGWPVVVLVPEAVVSTSHEDKWHIGTAQTLVSAGVKLGQCQNLQQVDIEFTPKTCFRLPHLIMQEATESLIRNLAAWELIKSGDRETPFASFIKLMDNRHCGRCGDRERRWAAGSPLGK